MTEKKGPTKAQLLAKVRRLQRELAKFTRGDRLRREGEHWYKFEDYFDGKHIVRVPGPWKEPTYMMGMVEDTFAVEVPEEATPEQVDGLLQLLRRNGVTPAFAIVRGVRFVKLATVDAVTEAKLDAEVNRAAASEGPTGQSSDDGGARPEPDGDGVGGGPPEDRSDLGGGCDSDREGQADGAVNVSP
jgi:hypothetical protein